MATLLPLPLAPLLEPESLCFGAPSSDRKMIVRVALRDGRRTGFYAALLEELDDGARLRVTDLVHDLVVGEFDREFDDGMRVRGGVCTYVEEVGDELRTMHVSWTEGTATESTSVIRLSVA